METLVPTKEIAQYKKEVESAEKFSEGLVIKSAEDYKSAMDEGLLVKQQLDSIVARKEEITKPLYRSYKSVLDLFKPLEAAGELALRTIKDKMIAWKRAEDRKVEDAKQKLAERVERGTMKPETAVRKIQEIQTPTATTVSETAKSTMKKVKKYRLVDVYALPKEFLKQGLLLTQVADITKVKASFQLGKPVPGVEEFIEEEMSLS